MFFNSGCCKTHNQQCDQLGLKPVLIEYSEFEKFNNYYTKDITLKYFKLKPYPYPYKNYTIQCAYCNKTIFHRCYFFKAGCGIRHCNYADIANKRPKIIEVIEKNVKIFLSPNHLT
jgi:hypothetical protein